MGMTGLRSLDQSLITTKEWLNDLKQELCLEDEQDAYVIMRAVIHALRDRLPIDEAVDLGAQLPMLLRGVYYDGWDPTGKPIKIKSQSEFLAYVEEGLIGEIDSLTITKGVFKILQKRISNGEIKDIKNNFPKDLLPLWSE
ncbi:MAG: DUF2267 domain-containing protein [bacterium]